MTLSEFNNEWVDQVDCFSVHCQYLQREEMGQRVTQCQLEQPVRHIVNLFAQGDARTLIFEY